MILPLFLVLVPEASSCNMTEIRNDYENILVNIIIHLVGSIFLHLKQSYNISLQDSFNIDELSKEVTLERIHMELTAIKIVILVKEKKKP